MAVPLRANAFVSKVLKNFMDTSGLEPTLLGAKHLRIINATPGTVKFELDVQRQHTNRLSILHGGTIASMVDLGGSLAVASMGLYATGVSTDLNVSYLSSGGKTGDTINVLAVCEKMGRTLAFTHISFYNSKGDLFARGSHTKYIERARRDQSSPYALPREAGDENGDKSAEPTS
ncbi:hypothetical protein VPNG_08276 [Cytospora leucostoma]|uniref:Thioesterase domain-containing protein n=1 Tax=Cytospora leucostoma TaxID=1230097 RepID=A0A423WCD4_9PEZI|nr:hypothetical protein VPNG_08276 [Cytospora leucostoma]